MRVIVIGGAGYMGSILVRGLLRRGHRVRVIDNLTFGDSPLAGVAAQVELDVRNMQDLEVPHLAGADAVVNCGGLSNDPTADWNPRRNWEENFHAVVRTARMSRDADVKKFIFASSCSVYDGVPGNCPPLSESSAVAPVGHYSQAKYAAEEALREIADPSLSIVAFRMATLFGPSPRMRFDLVVNTMLRNALTQRSVQVAGDGTLWRPLLSVQDAARAYVMAIEQPLPEAFTLLNLVGENRQLMDIARIVADAAAREGQPVAITSCDLPARVRSYRADGALARKILGFRPSESAESVARFMSTMFRSWPAERLFAPVYENIRWLSQAMTQDEVMEGSTTT